MTRNEGSSAIDDVLNSVASGEFKALEEVYAITLDSLKKQKDAGVRAREVAVAVAVHPLCSAALCCALNDVCSFVSFVQRFVFDVSMKQCRTYVDKKLFRKAEEVTHGLERFPLGRSRSFPRFGPTGA